MPRRIREAATLTAQKNRPTVRPGSSRLKETATAEGRDGMTGGE